LLQEASGLELVGEAASFADALRIVERDEPDIILLDLNLSDGNVLERISQLLDGGGKRKS